MATQRKPKTNETALNDAISADYTGNMFKDGHDRTETNKKAHDAPGYDRAAHTGAPMFPEAIDNDAEAPTNTNSLRSRDGTEASGLYDEEGGPLGGTEEELDQLESTATPVDRNPRMKD